MNSIIYTFFGEGKDLNMLQMGCRAFVMFFITLLLIRLAGMRSIGMKSAFDTIIVIILGSILSRAVVGVSPFFPTVIAGAVIAIVHKAIAIIAIRNRFVERLVKGEKNILFHHNHFIEKNMRRSCISVDDVEQELRLSVHENTIENIQEIFMERTGEISVIKK